jgi:hypothetical protein
LKAISRLFLFQAWSGGIQEEESLPCKLLDTSKSTVLLFSSSTMRCEDALALAAGFEEI